MYTFVRTARGLTLVELLGAMAISTLLVGSGWQLLQSGMRSYHHGLQEVRMTQEARTLLHIVTQDVQRALAAQVPHGITGPAPQSTTSAPDASVGDRLALLTLPSVRASLTVADKRIQPQRIRYVLKTAADQKTSTLQRVVTTGQEAQHERIVPVHEHVHALHIRYFDGQTWSDTWQQAPLPRAVEITLVAQSSGVRPRMSRFATLVTAQ
jgi:type II secretion system protein J